MSLAKAASVIVPSGDDWLVTIVSRSRRVSTRRISPGTMDEREAVRIALLSHGIRREDVYDLSVRRVGDMNRLDLGSESDPMARLFARLKA